MRKNYMKRLSDGTYMVNSRFKFRTLEEAEDYMELIKPIRITSRKPFGLKVK